MKYLYFLLFVLTVGILQAQIVNIPDPNFKNALVNTLCVDTDGDGEYDDDVDTNNDGEIQMAEAEAVVFLHVSDQNISSLEGIQSFLNLEILGCSHNDLTSLDLSHNNNLVTLSCGFNQLTLLDLNSNPNLEILWCRDNQLTHLDLSNNPNLRIVWCTQNQLSSLDLRNGNNSNIWTMWAYGNSDLLCIDVDDGDNPTTWGCHIPFGDGWCIDPWTGYSDDCLLTVEDILLDFISIYPNPARNVLVVDTKLPVDSISIYSIQGSLINKPSSPTIDVSDLKAGIYIVKMSIYGQTLIKKFIKS